MSSLCSLDWAVKSPSSGNIHYDTLVFCDMHMLCPDVQDLSHIELKSVSIYHDGRYVYGIQSSWIRTGARHVSPGAQESLEVSALLFCVCCPL